MSFSSRLRNTVNSACLVVAILLSQGGCLWAQPVESATPARFLSHPPMRELPGASARPVGKGQAYYVHPDRGADKGLGSRQAPWKTIGYASRQLKPGDTLYLQGGTYYEQARLSVKGTKEKPITIRSQPGELAIVDGGIREFYDQPATAWEPCPKGVEGEFWSTKSWRGLRSGQLGRAYVFGNFADSMIPLHGYRFRPDLQSTNMFWNLEKKSDKDGRIYCGPGVWYDATTERIHIRLAPTTLSGLRENNYQGETDPRKLRLIIAGGSDKIPLLVTNSQYVVIQDLVVRGGGRGPTIEVAGSQTIEFDGVTIYGGANCMAVQDTTRLRVLNCAFRGLSAPWTSRAHLKYRGVESRFFSAGRWAPNTLPSRDFEIANCEFTDSIDGIFLGKVDGVKFHHNLVDNLSDDGIFLTATTGEDGNTPGGNHYIYQNRISRCLMTFAFGSGHGFQKEVNGRKQTGKGVWIYRNVFDFRQPIFYLIPKSATAEQELTFRSRMVGDHGSPTWEPIFFYHNTVLGYDAPFRNYYAGGWGGGIQKSTQRRVFNNIFAYINGTPGRVFPSTTLDFQADGNVSWCYADPQGDVLGKFRRSADFEKSKARYEPGWVAHDQFVDPQFVQWAGDWRKPLDLQVKDSSPAINAGVPVPTEWPDPLRAGDEDQPDVGALPLGTEPWRIGVNGRLPLFP